eukprot:6490671-Amphidinium_carterae.2
MSMLGYFQDGGAIRALEQAVLGALPTEGVAKSLEESLAALRNVQKGTLFTWADADAQAQVRVVENLVAGLVESVVPSIATKSTEFVKTCFGRLPFFARVKTERIVKSEDEGKTTISVDLVGKEAVDHQWRRFQKLQKDGPVDVADFRVLAQHRWLLSATEKAKVEKALTSADAQATTTSSSTSTKKPTKTNTPAKGARPKTLGQVQSEIKRKAPQKEGDAKKVKMAAPAKCLEEQVDDLFMDTVWGALVSGMHPLHDLGWQSIPDSSDGDACVFLATCKTFWESQTDLECHVKETSLRHNVRTP